MKKLIFLFTALITLSVSSCALLKKDNEVVLKLNLVEGTQYQMETILNQNIFSDESMLEKLMGGLTTLNTTTAVKEVSEEGYVLETSIDRVQLSQEMQGVSLNYDSQEEAPTDMMGAMVHEQMAPYLENKTTTKLSKSGKRMDSDDGEGELPSGGSFLVEFPSTPIETGTIWYAQGYMNDSVAYEVMEITSEQVSLKVKTSSVVKEDGNDLTTASEGTIIIDRESGWPLSQSLKVTVQGMADGRAVYSIQNIEVLSSKVE